MGQGRPYFDPLIMQMLVTNRRQQDELNELTERELEVLQELAKGLSNRRSLKAICDRVYGEETCEQYLG